MLAAGSVLVKSGLLVILSVNYVCSWTGDKPVIAVQLLAGDCKRIVNRVRTTTAIMFSIVSFQSNVT